MKTWLSVANREPALGTMVIGLLVGSLLLWFGSLGASNLPFLLEGEAVQGTVVLPPARIGGGNFGQKYLVEYEYADATGKLHAGVGRVWTADEYGTGDRIDVRYLRSEPSRSRTEANVRDNLQPIGIAFLGAAITLLALGCGIVGIRRVSRQL